MGIIGVEKPSQHLMVKPSERKGGKVMSEIETIGDRFEQGIFWELYMDLERQFEVFLEYVPYSEQNENTCSFKLLNLILSIGGHVDSAFKEMARYPNFSSNEDCQKICDVLKKSEENVKKGRAPKTVPIWLSLKAFEKEYKLSEKIVVFKRIPEREGVKPFKPRHSRAKSPIWWKIYNGLKHDVSINLRRANLETALNALAGAFLLNVIHIPSYLRLHQYHVFRRKDGGIYTYSPKAKENLVKFYPQGKWFGRLETPLFICDLEAEAVKLFGKPT